MRKTLQESNLCLSKGLIYIFFSTEVCSTFTPAKGQLIWKCLFCVFKYSSKQRTKTSQPEVLYHSIQVDFFVLFFGRIEDTEKKHVPRIIRYMFLDGKYVQTSTARENNWTSGWFLDKWLTAVISHKIILLCRNFRSFSPIFQNSLPWKLEHTNQIPSLPPPNTTKKVGSFTALMWAGP